MPSPLKTRLENHKNGRAAYYVVSLTESPNSTWVVNCEYGRIGSAAQVSQKGESESYSVAEKIFHKAVDAKLRRGYTRVTRRGYANTEGGSSPLSSMFGQKREGLFAPQLLNPIDEDTFRAHCASGEFLIQEKHFGRRCLCSWDPSLGDKVPQFGNKNGEVLSAVSDAVVESISKLVRLGKGIFNFDGELMEDHYVIFDVVGYAGEDISGKPFEVRAKYLEQLKADLVEAGVSQIISVSSTFEAWANVDSMFDFYRGAEGLVLKKKSSSYEAGRPNSGGNQLKFKFYETATVRVSHHNQKRSVGIEVTDADGVWVGVGNVSIPTNAELPDVGALIEVRYLHAYEEGSLYEPVYLMTRDDVSEQDCVMSQLKFKSPDKTYIPSVSEREATKRALPSFGW